MLRNKSFTVEIRGKLDHQSPQENMQKLFDCIRSLLKRFLACLTFHRKKIRLRHLHKRTNPGSALNIMMTFFINWFNSTVSYMTHVKEENQINIGRRFIHKMSWFIISWLLPVDVMILFISGTALFSLLILRHF